MSSLSTIAYITSHVCQTSCSSSKKAESKRWLQDQEFETCSMIYNKLTMPLIVCTEVKSKTQGSRPRQRTQKNFEAKAKDSDARGQGQGPRTQTQVFPPKKKDLQNFFSGDLKKKVFKIFFKRKRSPKIYFQAISTWGNQKKVFADFPQGFWRFLTKFQQPRAEDRPIFEDLRLRGQGQGLQNVSSRPRTSSRTPPLVCTMYNFLLKHKLQYLD